MNRLWVRFSFIISGFFLVLILLPLGTVYALERFQLLQIFDDEPEGEEDRFAAADLLDRLVMTTAVVAAIGTGLGVWLSRELTAPIAELSAAAQKIGSGDLAQRVPIHSHSRELTELAESFNEMVVQLQHAETLRSHMLADVSHELRTPLTALSGQLHAALDKVYQLEEEEIANLYGQTQYLIRLVEDLHLLAQAEAQQLPLNLVSVNLDELWQEIAANFTLLAEEKSINFTLTMADGLPVVEADPIRMRQIFTNLLSNALRYTPTGGEIRVRITEQQACIMTEIGDSGEGVDRADLPHLFDRFFRTDASRSRDTGGIGLGLTIVKALVAEHGGTITAVSAGRNQGTTFTISFPLTHKEESND